MKNRANVFIVSSFADRNQIKCCKIEQIIVNR
jgi:hypothetical protein